MADISTILAWAAGIYTVVMFGVSIWASKRIDSTEDYLVAGRRLPLSLAWATLFATWFGAGTLLTATDEVAAGGLRQAALDPFGAGICLLIAGLWFAKPLWQMNLLTLADFYRERFGRRAEFISGALMIPGYTGWIAAQFVALAGMMELFFGLPAAWGILLVAVVGTVYTLIGGMWSVILTDAAQMALLIVGVVVLAVTTLTGLGEGSAGAGFGRLLAESEPGKLTLVPTDTAREFVLWLGVLAAGALGNIPGQDLTQRIFASRSANTARNACLIAGAAYLLVGVMPLVTGLAGTLLFDDAPEVGLLPYVAKLLLNPVFAVIFLLAVMSAVLSTIDSAILSPASVLSQNILTRIKQDRFDSLGLNHLAVVVIAAASLLLAYVGEGAYELLETAYEIGMVALLVPLALGMFTRRGDERSAIASMVVGTGLWAAHLALGWEFFAEPLIAASLPLPMGLCCAALATAAYLVVKPAPEVGDAW